MKPFLRAVLRELAYGAMLMSPFWHELALQEFKKDRAAGARAEAGR